MTKEALKADHSGCLNLDPAKSFHRAGDLLITASGTCEFDVHRFHESRTLGTTMWIWVATFCELEEARRCFPAASYPRAYA
jgi:hypothetical protein